MKRVHYPWPCLGSIWVALMMPAVMATTAPGCGSGDEVGTKGINGSEVFSCDPPIFNRTDDYGRPDPCCHFKPCCPSPVPDHYAVDPGSEPPTTLWDPCCLTELCPPHNPFWPKEDDKPTPGTPCDAGTDGQASSCTAPCDGECLARADVPGAGPLLFWKGPAGQEPGCPSGTTPVEVKRYADLDIPPLDCPSCSCDPPTGTCALPSTMTANSSGYPGTTPGTIHTDFSPPPAWNGACTSANAIAAGAACNGGPCVKSLTVAPLTLTESGCAPRLSAPPKESPAPSWQSSAVMCSLGPCDGGKRVCAPKADAKPSTWETCLAFAGDEATCSDPYPVRHVVYDSFKDSRTCGTCACDPPSGSYCVSVLSVSEGAACKSPAALPGTLITSQAQPFCFDLPAGVALGSKMMAAPSYTPGSCETLTKEGSGEVTKQGAVTLCCREPSA